MSPASSENVWLVTLYSAFSCIYLSIYLFALSYLKQFYNIGKRKCLLLIIGIALAECGKLILASFNPNATYTRERTTKIKKYSFKSKLKSVAVMFGMMVFYYFVAVLFGAPFLTQQEETFMFSLLLTTMTVLPSCLNLGAETTVSVLTELTTHHSDLFIEMFRCTICITLFGSWLGAIVIPLDWDRPWQEWPIPCSFGAIFGYMSGNIYMLTRVVPKFSKLFGKRTGRYGL